MIMRNCFIITVLFLTSVVWAQQPNIIVIVADDLGNADVGYHQQHNDIPTPAIDALAKSGVYFNCGYVTAPVCGPSRAGLLTGRYQQSFGFDDNPGPFRASQDVLAGIPPEIKIIPEYLKPDGYRTACIGKWHVGHEADEYFPTNRGFDHFFGFLGGAASYYPGDNESRTLFRGTKPVSSEGSYLTDAFGDEACQVIREQEKDPFFIYLAFNAVHGPLQEPPGIYREPFKQMPDGKRRTLCAMQYAMDVNIGKVLDALVETGQRDNTLVFFVSDNGGKLKGNYSYNTPYRGEKGTLYEGGIRLPFCVSWPGQVPAGIDYNQPVSTLDILPTILAAANTNTVSGLEGENLKPYLNGKKSGAVHDVLYWRINHRWAIRNEEWKLVSNEVKGQPMLFRIAQDKSELENLASERPDVVNDLQKQFEQWSTEMEPKQWGWSPSVGKFVRHPEEDFEGINTEQFFVQKDKGLIKFVTNPLRGGINRSDKVLKLYPSGNNVGQTMVVSMKTSVFQRRQRYLSCKVLLPELSKVLVEIKGNKGKSFTFEAIKEPELTRQWQAVVFDCKEFKGAVSQIKFTFKSPKEGFTKAVYLDDIQFQSDLSN